LITHSIFPIFERTVSQSPCQIPATNWRDHPKSSQKSCQHFHVAVVSVADVVAVSVAAAVVVASKFVQCPVAGGKRKSGKAACCNRSPSIWSSEGATHAARPQKTGA